MITGIVLAVLAAGCYGVAATCQHTAVHTVADGRGRLSLAQLTALLRRKRWLLGLLMMCLGAALHVVSLALAPLVVVQPIGVLAIGLAALLSARMRPDRATVFAVVAIAAGVGLFLLCAAPHVNPAGLPSMAVGRVLPVTGIVVAGLLLAARGWARCVLLATAAGVAYGTISVLARAVAEHVRLDGLAALAAWPTLLAVPVAMVVGAVCIQQAYASGRPDTVLAAQNVVDPLVGVLFGIFLFHETVGATPIAVFGELAGGALAVVGVLRLARRRVEPPITRKQAMDRPLRIIIGADTFPPDVNGAARFAHQLATGLAGRGHDVRVVCPSDTGPARVTSMDGVTVERLAAYRTPCHPTFRVVLPWQARPAVRDVLAEFQPDVVHVQAHFSVGRALVAAAAERNIPIVATNHFMPENILPFMKVPAPLRAAAGRLAWRDLARVLRRADVVTAPTPTAVQLLRQQGFADAVAVSCGVDLGRFWTDERGDGRTVLFVGRLDEEKRVHELLLAAAALPDVRVELVGDGACRPALEALAGRLGIADRVTFLGFVSDADLRSAYRRCAVFCMPGVAELQSLATMEAMATGRPVVAADAVALPHLVVPGHNGWLYPPGDVNALTRALASVLGGAAAEMGRASRELIRWHDLDRSLDTFEALYGGDIVEPLVSIPAVAVRP